MISGISKWDGSKAVNRKDYYICGDAIGDLRTTDNKLSVWKADTQEDINDAIVALALNRDSVSKLSYFLLKEEDLASNPQLSSSASFLRLNVLSSLN